MTSALSAALAVIIVVVRAPPDAPNRPAPASGIAQQASTQARPGPGSEQAGVDLSEWKLTIPTANEKGTAASISDPSQGAEPWLTRGPGGELRFWAPVAGATTPHSTHARTELVSLHSWRVGTGQHSLHASVAVTQVPRAGGDVIIGQIHGAEDIAIPQRLGAAQAAGRRGCAVAVPGQGGELGGHADRRRSYGAGTL